MHCVCNPAVSGFAGSESKPGEKEQYGILASMAEIYYRMYLVNLEQDSVIAYSDQTEE